MPQPCQASVAERFRDQRHEPGVGGVEHAAHLGYRRLQLRQLHTEQVYARGVTRLPATHRLARPSTEPCC